MVNRPATIAGAPADDQSRGVNRRGFLQRIGAAVVGLTLARVLPGIAPVPPTLTTPPGIYTAGALQRGDVFTIAGRYAVNPVTLRATDQLKLFVVTSDVDAGLVPAAVIYPPILTAGAYMNTHVSGHAAAWVNP